MPAAFENGKITGKTKVPFVSDFYSFKYDTNYTLVSDLLDQEQKEKINITDIVFIEGQSLVDALFMEGSGSAQSLVAAVTALIIISAF